MSQKKALIITYYWPPSGGSGVQRWLKFAKYLREFGWEPIIYTPSNPEYPSEDNSFLKDIPKNTLVIKRPIKEPYKFYKILTGKKQKNKIQVGFINESKTNSFFEKIARWSRGNLFIPDARKFWIKPSIKFLSKWLKENHVDIVVSTGPPHSMHLIALGLKKKSKIKWVADFRDPWTDIYYFKDLSLSEIAHKRHKKLEKACLDNADHIITVGKTMKNIFAKLTNTPINVITNGFDHSDYENVKPQKADKFTIMYTGSFLPDQNKPELWELLGNMVKNNELFKEHLELLFIGNIDFTILNDIEKNNLMPYLNYINTVPHSEIPQLQQKAALMLLSINRIENASYILTGKVFEYLASGKPILAICPDDSDVAEIIRETNSGWVVPFNQKMMLANVLNDTFQKYTENQLVGKSKNIHHYSRKNLTQQLSSLFNSID
jgi:glycosyltransferase involved in cell wall biosynthesis